MEASPGSVTFLNRFYWPDMAATAQILTDLAEHLAERGWTVTVITSRTGYAPSGGALPHEEVRRGVRIVRVGTSRFGRARTLARVSDYATYLWGASRALLRLPGPDVAVAMSDPPFLVLPSLVLGRLRGFRTVYWLQDLYPHLAVRLGVLRPGGVAHRVLHALAAALHRRCDRIVALGPRMVQEIVASGGVAERTTFVHNWADEQAVRPVPAEDNPFLRAHGLQGSFVVLYSGNAGRAHTFDAVLEAARRLQDDPKIVFLFVGGGKQMPALRAAAEAAQLANVRFLDYVPREELAFSLSAAACSLVTEAPDVVGLLVPSKTYGILASGRPLIFVGSSESDVARIVRDANCGAVVSPGEPDRLAEAIRALRQAPEEAARLGANARRAAEETYSFRDAAASWGELLADLRAGNSAPLPARRSAIRARF